MSFIEDIRHAIVRYLRVVTMVSGDSKMDKLMEESKKKELT